VKDRRLVYVHNHLGLAEYRIRSTEELPAGKAILSFRFTRTGEHRGHGALYIGERLIGEGEIPHTVPAVIETSGEGLCCGYDSGLPVTADYRAPFRFTGYIEQVVVDIGNAPATDPEALLRAVLTDH
jgi:arylsulfatase